jgi:hypothetical protein
MKKSIIALIGILIIITITSSLARANSGGISFQLSPAEGEDAHFIYDLKPGSQIEDKLTISNHGDIPVTVNLYPADAATGAAGGVVVDTEAEAPQLMGSWIMLEKEQITVPASSALNVDFSINVPDAPPAGKLAAGIVAQDVEVSEGTSALSVSSVQRSVVMILGTAPGELIPDLKIANVEVGHSSGMPSFGIELMNEGTTYVHPTGRLLVESPSGETISELPISLDLFMPRTEITHRVRSEDFLQTGDYIVDVKLNYGSTSPAHWRSEFTITDAEVEAAIAQAELAAEASQSESPVIIIQENGSNTIVSAAGISIIALMGSALTFLFLTRRKEQSDTPGNNKN